MTSFAGERSHGVADTHHSELHDRVVRTVVHRLLQSCFCQNLYDILFCFALTLLSLHAQPSKTLPALLLLSFNGTA